MGPVSYIIAIMGCADGAADCRAVATMPAQYQSQSACQAATSSVLAANTDFDFPTIIAQCRATKARPAAEKRERPRILPAASRQG